MTPAPKPPPRGRIALPRLSDDAAAEIHFFLENLMDLFEARYGRQVSRHYDALAKDNLTEPDDDLESDDSPF